MVSVRAQREPGQSIDEVEGKFDPAGESDGLGSSKDHGVVVDLGTIVGQLAFGMNGAALFDVGILVHDDDDGTNTGLSVGSTGDTGNVGDGLILDTFHIDAFVIVEEDDTHIAASTATIGTTIDKRTFVVRSSLVFGDRIHNKLMHFVFLNNLVCLSVDGDGAGSCASWALGHSFMLIGSKHMSEISLWDICNLLLNGFGCLVGGLGSGGVMLVDVNDLTGSCAGGVSCRLVVLRLSL